MAQKWELILSKLPAELCQVAAAWSWHRFLQRTLLPETIHTNIQEWGRPAAHSHSLPSSEFLLAGSAFPFLPTSSFLLVNVILPPAGVDDSGKQLR